MSAKLAAGLLGVYLAAGVYLAVSVAAEPPAARIFWPPPACEPPPKSKHREYLVQVHGHAPDFYQDGQRYVNCTGALVSRERVLTSAKCLRGFGAPGQTRLWLVSGQQDRYEVRPDDIWTYWVRPLKRLAAGQADDPESHGLALIRVPSSFSRRLTPACLPEPALGLPPFRRVLEKRASDDRFCKPRYIFYSPEYRGQSVFVHELGDRRCPPDYDSKWELKLCIKGDHLNPGDNHLEGAPLVSNHHNGDYCPNPFMLFALYSGRHDPWSDSQCPWFADGQDNDFYIRFDKPDNELTKWLATHRSALRTTR